VRFYLGRWIIVGAIAPVLIGSTLTGCAASRRGGAVATAAAESPATRPAATNPAEAAAMAQAQLHLDQITPVPVLPKARAPSTGPTSAPLDAIELYARAREAQIQRRQGEAISDIEKAIALDPNSFELELALGRAYLAAGRADQAISAYDRATQINPNSLDAQAELGRAYQARNDLTHAIERFRLAMQTDDYRTDESLAAVVDYRLAISLQQKGYDRAALECFTKLLNRLQHSASEIRGSAEIGYLLNRPEALHDEIGKLYEKLGEYPEALREYQWVAQNAPGEFDLQARVASLLVKMGRNREAAALATDLVRKFRASVESMTLLREVYQKNGSTPTALADALRKVYREQPNDRSILFALSDTLQSNGQPDQARDLLEKALESHDSDIEIVERLWKLYADQDRVADAARLIIRVTAAHPDTTTELLPQMMDLTRLSRKNSLRVPSLQKIDVPASAQASKNYWIWKIGSTWSRPGVAKAALEQAAAANPPFDPAVVAQLEAVYARTDLDEAGIKRAVEELITSVQNRGRPDLAAQLKGLSSLHNSRTDDAANFFGQAVQLAPSKNPSPDLQLAYALSLLPQGNQARFEQLMWKLVSDRPHFDAGFQVLLAYLKQGHADTQAASLINTWLASDPGSRSARLEQVRELIEQRRVDDAVAMMRRLFDQYPDDPDVVGSYIQVMNGTRKTQELLDSLEAERQRHPNNRMAVEALVELYASQDRMADAAKVVDAARAAVATDPELLYYIAHLYQRINQPDTSNDVLVDVLKLDPTNPQAGNDLGYSWADKGENLEKAESLIRLAVNAEPDNPSYLDSLGWVLYKRSKFQDAVKLLEQACEPQSTADPIVLDHLGDTLYRLNRTADAKIKWQLSLQRMEQLQSEREDLKTLRLQLQAKLRQADAGQTVNVAPVVEGQPQTSQAQTQANKEQ
jgi:tetratricopeptide (TPR) repeat protein